MRRINNIVSENPQQKMWDTFMFFESEPTCKNFLMKRYEEIGLKSDAHRYAFQNTDKLIYHIKQSREYYKTAHRSDILVKPLLLYYGMVSLVKALILCYDPHYPRQSRLLKHGVTTRKIKQKNYSFHKDEIKIQREGLFPLLFDLVKENNHSDLHDKYKVLDLLSLLPELHDAYKRLYGKETLILIHLSERINFSQPTTMLYLPEYVLDHLHLTYNSFISHVNRFNTGKSYFAANPFKTPNGIIRIEWVDPDYLHVSDSPNGFNNDLFIQDYKGNFYFSLVNDRGFLLPEECIHFMLMYNLGMLCRYDTDIWGDIIFSFTSGDMYIINEFLELSARKFPNLILNLLMEENFIFESL